MEYDVNHICITGPESTGKSTLCAALLNYNESVLVDEYARQYLKNVSQYVYEDLYHIATGQYMRIMKAKEGHQLVFSDTDLLTIVIWSKYVYGKVDADVFRLWLSQLPQRYILCKPDIPWEYDPLRENPTDRDSLFTIYKSYIDRVGVPCEIVEGCRESFAKQWTL